MTDKQLLAYLQRQIEQTGTKSTAKQLTRISAGLTSTKSTKRAKARKEARRAQKYLETAAKPTAVNLKEAIKAPTTKAITPGYLEKKRIERELRKAERKYGGKAILTGYEKKTEKALKALKGQKLAESIKLVDTRTGEVETLKEKKMKDKRKEEEAKQIIENAKRRIASLGNTRYNNKFLKKLTEDIKKPGLLKTAEKLQEAVRRESEEGTAIPYATYVYEDEYITEESEDIEDLFEEY